MNMRRVGLCVISALTVALGATRALGQDDTVNRGARDLNVSITLEDASQSRAAVANLELPIEQEQRPSSAPPEQARRFEPADFARPNRLESIRIAAGDLPRGTMGVAVRCQGFIGADGGLGDYYCVSDDNRAADDIVQAVIDAVPTQRFVAARVDGQEVRVLMNFAVYVDCSSGPCLAVAGRNHGYHIGSLGFDYVDPQPILEGNDWYVGFDYKLRWLRSWMPRIMNVDRWYRLDERLQYVMAVEVDASGIAAPGCLYWVGVSWVTRAPSAVRNFPFPSTNAMAAPALPPRTKGDIERAIASLGRVRYVPGMIDGTPTALRLHEESLTRWQDSTLGPGVAFGVGDIDCK
jgi:hypothetical protein